MQLKKPETRIETPKTPEEALAYMLNAQADLSLNMMAVLNEMSENIASIAVDIDDLVSYYKTVHKKEGTLTEMEIEEQEEGE